MLSSLPGSAISSIKIDGVLHEFQTIDGVYEDVTTIILNLKGVVFKNHSNEPKTVRINATKEGEVTAADIEHDADIEVINYTEEKGIHFVPIKYIMKHKVSKEQFKIKTKSGKEIIVTGDHSCIVFRNGKQLEVKAKDINKDTDKILTIICEK